MCSRAYIQQQSAAMLSMCPGMGKDYQDITGTNTLKSTSPWILLYLSVTSITP